MGKYLHNKNDKKKPSIFLILVVILSIVGIGGVYFVYSEIGPYNKSNNDEVIVEIPSGSSTKAIATILADNSLIKNEMVFTYNAKISGQASSFKAGKYSLKQSQTNNEMIDIIASGRVVVEGIKVTFPEGLTYSETIDILVKNDLGDEEVFVEYIYSPEEFYDDFEFLDEEDITTLEGFLYPSTYYFDEKSDEKQILTVMLNQFKKVYNDVLVDEIENTDMTLQEIVNLASIVEKEAIFDEDRPIIASVFFNRLDINMPLQSDATLQYAFEERKEIVLYKDLEIDSLYNSYKNRGLPPTPISNPSVESIEAVIYPKQTDYLYFVATMQGGNNYSTTYQQHLDYVREYKEERAQLKAEQENE